MEHERKGLPVRFPWQKKTEREGQQPPADQPAGQPAGIPWFWVLTIDGMPTANFDWPEVLRGLEALRADPDSFLVLERRNPENQQEAGFLQCAVNLGEDRPGWYTVECGYPGPEGPVLLRKEVPSVLEAIPIFEAVYRRRGTVFSGFSDLSDAMAQHSL